MGQKGYSLTPVILVATAIALVGGIYLISSSKINIKNPISTPFSQPTKTAIPEGVNCTTDEDCGVNICACTAMNKAYIETKDKICTRYCEGEPKCVNNKCELVKVVDPCKQLDEYSCSKADNCRSNYEPVGPSRDKVGMSLDNFKFTFCSSLSPAEIDRIRIESQNCRNSGGYWTRTKGNPTGICVK